MRYKLTLEVVQDSYGTVLPISYQYELSVAINNLLTSNNNEYSKWLLDNGFTVAEAQQFNLYAISNLYVPKIYVQGDRLQINVPRVQLWISVLPEINTDQFLHSVFDNNEVLLGDQISKVLFRIVSLDVVSPVVYTQVMKYQSLSPIVVLGVRPNNSIEYLFPQNRFFSEFFVQNLIDRWEFIHKKPYVGNHRFSFQLLRAEKRKAVSLHSGSVNYQKVIGYMIKFRLIMDPLLQEMAYVCGIGDYINQGFGYLELLDKSSQ